MNGDLRELNWPELLELMRDQTSYWLLAYNSPGSLAWERRFLELEDLAADTALIGDVVNEEEPVTVEVVHRQEACPVASYPGPRDVAAVIAAIHE